MANFNKAFNFRGGFQVDTDVLVVRGQSVGIGSTIPSERLDVDGIVKASGLIVDSTETFYIETATVNRLDAQVAAAGIFTGLTANGGIATYYGDGAQLLNLPTSQWLDIDVGLGFTSIYAQGYVGVDTTDPRYPFQVGGVPFGNPGAGPFLPQQRGVGIEDGDIYASGIITTRGEFIGLGSNIIALNADNMTLGTIGTERIGPIVYTDEVVAPKLTGIASTALNVVNSAEVDVVSLRAPRIEATGKFISTTGFVQVGEEFDDASVGDIEAYRAAGNTNIFSVSEDDQSSVFVGQQRPGSGRRQFGGIRRGLVASDPLTTSNDLDIVNYDIGNLNFYLHAGSGGASVTNGSIRWIYSQNNTILADLDRFGKFELTGNINPSNPTLSVTGLSDLVGDTSVTGDLSVSGLSTVTGNSYVGGDLDVVGNLNLLSGAIVGDIFSAGNIQVGGNPTAVSETGALLDTSGVVSANLLELYTNGVQTITTTLDGDVFATGIGSFNSLTSNTSVVCDTVVTTTSISGPNFLVNTDGILVSNVETTGAISAASSVTSNSVYAQVGNFDVINVENGPTFTSLNVTGTLSASSATIPTLSGDVNISGDLIVGIITALGNIRTTTSIEGSTIRATNILEADQVTPIGAATTFTVLSDLNINGTSISAPVAEISANQFVSSSNRITLGAYEFSFTVDEGDSSLGITVFNSGGSEVGAVNLAFGAYTTDDNGGSNPAVYLGAG